MGVAKPYLLIAHRGERVLSPENTIQACELALRQGATGLEVDVRLSRSGDLVLFHDWLLSHHFYRFQPTVLASSQRLATLSFRKHYVYNDRICTLESFLEHFRHTVPINLDVKFWGARYGRIARKLVTLLEKMKMRDQVWISSFNPFLLRCIKSIHPTVRTGYLFQDPVRIYQMIDPFLESDAWHPHHKNATDGLIEKAHQLKKEIYIWTVNDETDLQRIEKYRFNGIITDTFFRTRPDAMLP